jgi:hypothetical protein
MTARGAYRLGQGIGLLVAIGLVIAFALLGDALRLSADDADGDVLVWFYDADAAPGQRLAGRVWVDGVATTVVGGDVKLIGQQIGVDDCPADCKASYADFDFVVPEDVGDAVTLDISVETRPGPEWKRFQRIVPLYGKGMSVLRRVGKAVLALALIGIRALLLFGLARRATRRQRDPSGFWLVPVIAVGYLAFVPLMIDATRLLGLWFDAVALAAWFTAASWLATRLDRHIGLTSFEAHLMMVEMAADAPFRGASSVAPIRPVEDVENAWLEVGLAVRRAGADLIVTAPGGAFAVVPVPASASFGGEPLRFRASDPDLAELMVSAATNVLGELRLG